MALLGGLKNVRYEADSGEYHNAKVGQTTLQLNIGGTAQLQPTSAATTEEWVRAQKNQNEWGLEMREIGYCYTEATVPAGKKAGRTYKANILTQAAFNGLTIGATVSVDGGDAEVVSKKRETRTPES